MCGIAGAVDLDGRRLVPSDVLQTMAESLIHRGPDEDGFFQQDGVSLASRRLSIVGLLDGRQPITNEDLSVHVVFNGELFDHRERRAELESRGHHFRTSCDTEIIPHLWEEHGERMFDFLQGQFAFALYDDRQRRLIIARDRFGICPLYWSRRGDWLVFASEIRALLASGLVPARVDPRGIAHVFTFFAAPGPASCFEGVSALLPGRYLDVELNAPPADSVREKTFWKIQFPQQGQEDRTSSREELVTQFEDVLYKSVERRLRADVPVVSYLSGGVDSSLVVAMANKALGRAIPTFTIRIDDPKLDETSEARIVSDHLGCDPTVINVGAKEVIETYPRLVAAAEAPVIDTSCAGLLLLAQTVHDSGYKVALTGEGADEWLAGYSWFKMHKALSYLDVIPGLRLSDLVRRAYLRLSKMPRFPKKNLRRSQRILGGHNAWLDVYGMMSASKLRYFSPEMWDRLGDHFPFDDLQLDHEDLSRWHPFHRSLYLGGRVQLPGLLLNCKGDRVAMHSSVETRYPFLDEEVFEFLAKQRPRWKLSGFRDKYLLRLVAERWLPKSIAWRRKAMFRAPFDSFHVDSAPQFVEQLLSPESLRHTGYFDVEAVHHWRSAFQDLRNGSPNRLSAEMGFVGVLATQLWHHLFIDSTLCELPGLGLTEPQVAIPQSAAASPTS